MEEIARQHRGGLGAQELPRRRPGAVRCGRYPQPFQHPPHRRQLELQLNALAEINEEDPRMARVITLGWLAELGTFETPFPIFESFRNSIRLGQESGDFRASLSPDTVAEILCACYTDTLHRWLYARQHDGKPFPLAPALQAKLSLVLDGLAAPQA